MAAIRHRRLPVEPSYISAGGAAEIRMLLQFPAGELTHARVSAGMVSLPGRVHPSSEWFYVAGGRGQLWLGGPGGSTGDVLELPPGRSVRIPPGTPFQYRASAELGLDLLLAVMPQWRAEYHGVLAEGAWAPTGGPATDLDQRGDLPAAAETGVFVYDQTRAARYPAPDTSQVTLLGSEPAGSLALCELAPANVSVPVRHRSVEELWYVLSGRGIISRRQGPTEPFLDELQAGDCVDIGTGLTFQFRCTSQDPLRMVLLTLPCWPGADEAILAPELATWPPHSTDAEPATTSATKSAGDTQ